MASVKLKYDPNENWEEELGELLSVDERSQTAIVQVKSLDKFDDGLREVSLDQIESIICELCGRPSIPFTVCVNDSLLHNVID